MNLFVTLLYRTFLPLYSCLTLIRHLFLRVKGYPSRSFKSYFMPDLPKGDHLTKGPIFWFHAVSVGEVRALMALIPALHRECKGAKILLSTVTPTGYAEIQRSFSEVEGAFLLPFDWRWVMNRLLKKISPDLFILSETDYWPTLLHLAKKRRVPCLVVNGKLSEKSQMRYLRFPWMCSLTFDAIDHFILQSKEMRRRYLSVGIPPERLEVGGNLKCATPPPLLEKEKQERVRQRIGLPKEGVLMVLGSTHAPEEELLLEALLPLLEKNPNFFLAFVPRHPQRFQEVELLLEKSNHPFSSFSKGTREGARLFLVDTMGWLVFFYQLATFAFVGGTFCEKVGGHNLFEPLWGEALPLFGPQVWGQQEMAAQLLHAGAALQVDSPEELSSRVQELLLSPEELLPYRQAARKLLQEARDPLEKTLHSLIKRVAANRDQQVT